MLFLLNDTVISVPPTVSLPEGLGWLVKADSATVLNLGKELYAQYPQLQRQRPDIAVWFCSLMLSRVQPATGAWFYETDRKGIGCTLAEVSIRTLAALWRLQVEGLQTGPQVREIWAKAMSDKAA